MLFTGRCFILSVYTKPPEKKTIKKWSVFVRKTGFSGFPFRFPTTFSLKSICGVSIYPFSPIASHLANATSLFMMASDDRIVNLFPECCLCIFPQAGFQRPISFGSQAHKKRNDMNRSSFFVYSYGFFILKTAYRYNKRR